MIYGYRRVRGFIVRLTVFHFGVLWRLTIGKHPRQSAPSISGFLLCSSRWLPNAQTLQKGLHFSTTERHVDLCQRAVARSLIKFSFRLFLLYVCLNCTANLHWAAINLLISLIILSHLVGKCKCSPRQHCADCWLPQLLMAQITAAIFSLCPFSWSVTNIGISKKL